MKGLILSGGRGTRLRPITYTAAKQLVPVANKPILFYAIEALQAAGIREIGVVIGETGREVREAVGDGSRWGVEIGFIEQEAPLGLAHAVKISQPFLGNDPFVMYLGDNLIRGGIQGFVDEFRDTGPDALILLSRVANPRQFGVAELNGKGQVVRLEEKPAHPKSDLALVGVYLFNPSIFEAVYAIRPSARGELEITDAIQELINNGKNVRSHVIKGYWKDTGKLEDMLEANRILLDDLEGNVGGTVVDSQIHGRVRVEEGTVIQNSTVRGPVAIGRNCRLTNTYVGPYTSIYHGVRISNAEIEHSIILEDSVIEDLGARIEDSLIGKNVRIGRSQARPAAYRLMVGDYSEVGII